MVEQAAGPPAQAALRGSWVGTVAALSRRHLPCSLTVPTVRGSITMTLLFPSLIPECPGPCPCPCPSGPEVSPRLWFWSNAQGFPQPTAAESQWDQVPPLLWGGHWTLRPGACSFVPPHQGLVLAQTPRSPQQPWPRDHGTLVGQTARHCSPSVGLPCTCDVALGSRQTRGALSGTWEGCCLAV